VPKFPDASAAPVAYPLPDEAKSAQVHPVNVPVESAETKTLIFVRVDDAAVERKHVPNEMAELS